MEPHELRPNPKTLALEGVRALIEVRLRDKVVVVQEHHDSRTAIDRHVDESAIARHYPPLVEMKVASAFEHLPIVEVEFFGRHARTSTAIFVASQDLLIHFARTNKKIPV